jgi:hypothetical protein
MALRMKARLVEVVVVVTVLNEEESIVILIGSLVILSNFLDDLFYSSC